MAEEIRSNCVGCGVKPCMDCKCVVHICDECEGEFVEELYDLDGFELCEECAEKYCETVFHESYTVEEKIELLKL